MAGKVQICGISTDCLPKLTREESLNLLKKAKMGDMLAREQFLMSNLRLVLSIIKRFSSAKESPDDMFQAGCMGLVKAFDNFDVSVGVMFSTYAVPMIIGEVKRLIRGHNSLRISRSIRDTAYNVLKVRAELEGENIIPSIEEIAKRLNTTESEVAYALDAIADTVSLHEPVYNKDGDVLELMDQIKDEHCDENILNEKLALEQAIQTLDGREKKILYMRYYEGKTQTEISEEIGISQAQISRLEKGALLGLRRKLEVK